MGLFSLWSSVGYLWLVEKIHYSKSVHECIFIYSKRISLIEHLLNGNSQRKPLLSLSIVGCSLIGF